MTLMIALSSEDNAVNKVFKKERQKEFLFKQL